MLQVQSDKQDKHDINHSLSMECRKQLLAQDSESFSKDSQHDVEAMSEETESITLTMEEDDRKDTLSLDRECKDTESCSSSSNSSTNNTEQSEFIQLQDDDDEEEDEDNEYQMMLVNAKRGYKRMELKGESESDKDLIIYSLNESLQIHKEIVERIQVEKDTLENQHEQTKMTEKEELEKERMEIESKRNQVENQANKLEVIHQKLMAELEEKKLEYRRMETRFFSHVKSVKSNSEEDIYPQINHLFGQIHNLCNSIKTKLRDTNSILSLDWNTEAIQSIEQHLSPLDPDMVSVLTEKIMVQVIVQDIFQTPIHPGVSLNDSFGKIYNWVDKRNSTWASRMRQQIASFVVKQSSEENDQIDLAKEEIIEKMLAILGQVYNDADKLKRKVMTIVNTALKVNLALKCQENPIEIIPIEEGGITRFNENTMIPIENNTGDSVLLVISPHIVASNGFSVPAKVYCV